MWLDIRYALRTLRRNPGFAVVAILTLALGIGANTAIFTVFNGVLLRPLSYPQPDRLVAVQEVVPKWARFGPALPVTAWHFREWRKQSSSFDGLALVGGLGFTLTSGGDPELVNAQRVSPNLFPLLGIQASLGRTFTEAEDQPGSDHVVVLSDRLWARRFHRDPAIVGGKILLGGAPYQVVGVLPPDARIPTESQLEGSPFVTSAASLSNAYDAAADLWKPFAIADSDLAVMAEFDFGCLARLKRGVTITEATADLNVIQSAIAGTLPEKTELRASITGLQVQMTGSSRSSLTLLLAAAGAVMVIVIVNLANLLLARASGRRRELAIRAAIGAGAARLVRQMLTESLLLAAAGGLLGALAADWALTAIIWKAPLDVPRLHDLHMDFAALSFAALLSMSSGVLFGVLPAWGLSRTDPQRALKSAGHASTDRAGGRVRRLLISAEVALGAMCLVAGGLLLSSFVRLIHVDKGFQTDRAIEIGLGLPGVRYPDAASHVRFVRELLDQVQTLPGVVAAGITNRGPLSGEGSNLSINVEGVNLPAVEQPIVDYRTVTPGFFRAMGVPLLDGRLMAESDRDRPVAVVSAQAARRLWPNQNPIGRRFQLGSDAWFDVIGISGDVRASLHKTPNLTVYLPYWQRDRSDFALVVRTAIDPMTISGALRVAIRRMDPQLVVPQPVTLAEIVDASVRQRRFQLGLVLAFALSALLLAAIGVYGVVSQSVTQRSKEMGIRIALGAPRRHLWGVIARYGLSPVVAGLCAGLGAAAFASRWIDGLLFGVPAIDPLTYLAVAAALLGAASLACYLPARRAARVDPLAALRNE
ncbi:MAG: ABC transporter permease [Bryobacteraceae bacterium]